MQPSFRYLEFVLPGSDEPDASTPIPESDIDVGIPAFDEFGLLPPFIGGEPQPTSCSPYFATWGQVVERFSFSGERRRLLAGLQEYRREIEAAGFIGVQLLGGSFVEDVERSQSRPPNDIDVVSFVGPDPAYLVGQRAWGASEKSFWADVVDNKQRNRAKHSVDATAVFYPDVSKVNVLREGMWCISLFSHRKSDLRWKGVLVLPLGLEGPESAHVG